jgi:Xaa-Pro aminopeptidase
MDATVLDADACRARRARLTAALPPEVPVALIFAGAPVARNYPAAAYPFRASSHFLYLVGLPLEAGVLRLEGEHPTLFVPTPTADDALWHGAPMSFQEIGELTGLTIEPLEKLGAAGLSSAATLPAPDAATRESQTALLGRKLSILEHEGDRCLATAMVELRLRHDDAAKAGLKRAAGATVAAHTAGLEATRGGSLEAVVRAALEGEVLRRNMTTAYTPIVTTRGEVLHNHAYHHKMQPGDVMLVDFGAETPDGWAGDVTRCWPVSGSWSGSQRDAYQLVLTAQQAAIEAVRPGARYRDVHLTACRSLASGLVDVGILRGDVDELVADGVHALFFPHGVGHLLGLDVHDMEDLGDLAGYPEGRHRSEQFGLSYLRLDRDLEAGMAVTIEPGFYQVPAILEDPERLAIAGDRLDRAALERFADVRGIRIEDDILVTEAGSEVLTDALPKEPGAVANLVGGAR